MYLKGIYKIEVKGCWETNYNNRASGKGLTAGLDLNKGDSFLLSGQIG